MIDLESGRSLTAQYKEEFKGLALGLLKNDREDEMVIVLSALGEMTAELGIGIVGPKMTVALFHRLAAQVEELTGQGS